jgi:5-methylcytosine-specific restriction endonuclease McrA
MSGLASLEDHVLMLNKHWVPLDTCTVKHAFGRLWTGTAKFLEVENFRMHELENWLDLPVDEDKNTYVRASRIMVRAPEVIILVSGAMPKARDMTWSRRNLLRRDRSTCQYCGMRMSPDRLTIDHVMPKRKHGKTCFENCVMACKKCNSYKADRTPAEAGMTLIERPEMKILHPSNKPMWTKPYKPTWSPLHRVHPKSFKQSWKQFVSDKLEASMAMTT